MKTYAVTHSKEWRETRLDFVVANTHKEVSLTLPKKTIRVLNPRFREIEMTGEFYRITEVCKGGKNFIFEVLP